MLVKNINYINSIECFPSDFVIKVDDPTMPFYPAKLDLVCVGGARTLKLIVHTSEVNTLELTVGVRLLLDSLSDEFVKVLDVIDLEHEINLINGNLSEGMRYFNVVKNKLLELSKPDIIASLKELALEEYPVYENNIGIKVNNYDLCEKYLILDDINCENHSQIINDCQIEQLLQLQIVLEELNIKEKLMFENIDIPFDSIFYCIPGYFRVKGE